MTTDLAARAVLLVQAFARHGVRIATAESCTGGLIAATITGVPGSSAVFDRGFVTYSNAAKTDLVGVPAELIDSNGAVSEAIARRMAEGALTRSLADVAIAVTGIAGPGGGSADKPVGLVHFAVAGKTATHHRAQRFGALGRDAIRWESVNLAFDMLEAWFTDQGAGVDEAATP